MLVYKFTHGADYLQCSEMFTIDKSFVNMVLHKLIITVNIVIRNQIRWPWNEDLLNVMVSFKDWCGLLSI